MEFGGNADSLAPTESVFLDGAHESAFYTSSSSKSNTY